MSVIIEINLHTQQLSLFESSPKGQVLLREYAVSTALNGAGETKDSFCTPRGPHRIEQKIGEGAPPVCGI